MRTTILATFLFAACDADVVDRDFKPAPSPATCLVIEEVFTKPASGSAVGWQWVNVYNRCPDVMPLAKVEVRWTATGGEWVNKMPLAPLKTVSGYGCLTVGGPKSGPQNAAPTYTSGAKSFSPIIDDPMVFGTAAGVGLFVTSSKLPLAAVIFGEENLEGIEGVDGDVALEVDAAAPAPGHSLRRYAGKWIDDATPEPQHCGLY